MTPKYFVVDEETVNHVFLIRIDGIKPGRAPFSDKHIERIFITMIGKDKSKKRTLVPDRDTWKVLYKKWGLIPISLEKFNFFLDLGMEEPPSILFP